MFSQVSDKQDLVTMTLFSKERGDGSFHPGMFNELDNVQRIMAGLTEAAVAVGNLPPQFILCVNLIPDWDRENNSYQDESYLRLKTVFMERVHREFDDPKLKVIDFVRDVKLNADELAYLFQLRSGGSNPDMLKTRAIIDYADRRHLQIDTNTKIAHFHQLYGLTFGMPDDQQCDRLNACFYDANYVSAHNKIVYTHPGGVIAKQLAANYFEYCKLHKNDERFKSATSNTIYGILFVKTMHDLNLTIDGVVNTDKKKTYLPANLLMPEYGITCVVVSAVNRTWDSKTSNDEIDELKKINPVVVGDAKCDFASYCYLVKKYTGDLFLHQQGVDKTEAKGNARKMFLKLADVELDMQLMAMFYNHVLENKPELITKIARVLPNTKQGNRLCDVLFNCSVKELLSDPKRKAVVPIKEEVKANQTAENAEQSVAAPQAEESEKAKIDVSESSRSKHSLHSFFSSSSDAAEEQGEDQNPRRKPPPL